MLISHISDLHLGYSQFNLEEREEDVYATFQEAIDVSISEGIKLVILAGDIFHIPRPTGKAVYKLAIALKKLKEKQIPVAFVLGEHDLSRMRDIPFAHIFSNLGLARQLKLDEPFVVDNCSVYGANKQRRSNIDELASRLGQLDQTGKTASERQHRHQQQKGKKILVLHQGITDMNKFAGELNSTDLPGNFDYYAMGHYHDHIEKRYANLGGPLVYPGSIDLTPSEGIKDVEKGFALVDMSGEEASVQFIPLHRRPQFSMKVDFANMQKGVEAVIKKATSCGSKPVVKVEVEGRNIDSAAVSNSLLELNKACLHYIWQSVDEQAQALAFDERPADLDAELLRLAKDALGSEESATLAIRDLLPPTAVGDVSAALDIVWDIFKKRLSSPA